MSAPPELTRLAHKIISPHSTSASWRRHLVESLGARLAGWVAVCSVRLTATR